MKTKKIILLAFLAILAFSSCKGEELGRCDLPKGLIPYKKGQVYSFIDGAGQTIDVPVTKSTWDWVESRDETEYDYYTYRSQIVRLNTESNSLRIRLGIDAVGCMIGINYNEIGISIGILDKSSVFALHVDGEGNILTDTHTSFHKSIEINGKIYYDVFERNIVTNAGISNQLFYNKTYGILQVNKNGENFLTINHEPDEKNTPSLRSAVSIIEEDIQAIENEVEIGISEEIKQEQGISIFPNPSKGIVFIRSTNQDTKIISVYNALGALIHQQASTQQEIKIDLSRFSDGVYTFVIETNGKQVEHKVILSK